MLATRANAAQSTPLTEPPPRRSHPTPAISERWRIVGLPCGQCHGWSIVPMCCTTYTRNGEPEREHEIAPVRQHKPTRTTTHTEVICRLLSAVPIMTLRLHARIANMARALEQRTIWPAGRSCIRCSSSSRSASESPSACQYESRRTRFRRGEGERGINAVAHLSRRTWWCR